MTTGTKRVFHLHGIPYGTRRAIVATTLGCFTAMSVMACGGEETPDKPGTGGSSSSGGSAGAPSPAAGGGGGSSTTTTGGAGGTGGASGGSGGAGTAVGGAGGETAGAGGGGGQAAGVGGAGGGAGGGGGGASGGAGPCTPGRALSLSGNIAGKEADLGARVEVEFGADVELPVGNTNRTVEFWAFVPVNNWVGGVNTMFFYGTEMPRPACGFGLDFGSRGATLDPFTNGGYDADNIDVGVLNDMDRWIHMAMTWDGTAVRLFVNGVEKNAKMGDMGATMLKTPGSTPANPLVIGSYPTHGNFSGAFDEFRVWNVARTAAEITANMNKQLVGNEPGLTAYYKFDETTGTTTADSVAAPAKAHPGTLKSADAAKIPTFIPSTAPICP